MNTVTIDQAADKANSLIDTMLPIAQRIVATGQEHIPVIVVQLTNGRRDVTGVAPGMSKDDIARLFRSIAAHPQVEVAALVLESWKVAGKTTDAHTKRIFDEVQAGRLAVRDIPSSTEAIVYNVIVGGRRQFLCMCDIDRASNSLTKGELIDLDHRKEGEHVEGRFVGNSNAAKGAH